MRRAHFFAPCIHIAIIPIFAAGEVLVGFQGRRGAARRRAANTLSAARKQPNPRPVWLLTNWVDMRIPVDSVKVNGPADHLGSGPSADDKATVRYCCPGIKSASKPYGCKGPICRSSARTIPRYSVRRVGEYIDLRDRIAVGRVYAYVAVRALSGLDYPEQHVVWGYFNRTHHVARYGDGFQRAVRVVCHQFQLLFEGPEGYCGARGNLHVKISCVLGAGFST